MKIEYNVGADDDACTIETVGDTESYPWMRRGVVYDFGETWGEYGPVELSPEQARAKAAALLRAADDATRNVN